MSSTHNHGSKASNARVAGSIDTDLTAEVARAKAAEAALDARVKALEAPAIPPQPPASGIPAIGPKPANALLHHDFATMGMGPFGLLTYPDQHPGDNMEANNRFANGKPTIHDGYLDLPATRRSDGLWDATMVGTSQDGSGPTYGYGLFEFCCRANVGRATWQSAWLYDTTTWTATEIDWPEMLENLKVHAGILGQGAGGSYMAPPGDWATAWHTFYIDRRATYVAFGWDGVEKYRKTAAMPATKLAVLLDSKLGFPWAEGPDSTTPNPTWFQVAWVRVTP